MSERARIEISNVAFAEFDRGYSLAINKHRRLEGASDDDKSSPEAVGEALSPLENKENIYLETLEDLVGELYVGPDYNLKYQN